MNERVTDQFEAWRVALASGKPVAYERGAPTAGYYKLRARNKDRSLRWDAVAIWEDDGNWYCLRSGPFQAPKHADEIEEIFVSCNSSPISYELFESVSAGGAWPDEVAPAEVAADLPPHEAAAAELKAQHDAAKAWLHELGRKPQTQVEADKAGNFGSEFAKLETKVEKLRVAEKAPLLEAEKEIDAKWVPTRDAAKAAKTWAKGLSNDFAIAEKARRQREADEENAKRRLEYETAQANENERAANEERLRAKGVQLPESARAPVEPPRAIVAEPVRVGTVGRRQSLRTVPTYEVEDASALLRWLADRNERSLAFVEAALIEGKRHLLLGMIVPGILVGEKDVMQ